jgi:UDP-hydrolysing UDP-N-acetyl-D-glucosamine 2-epimerase
MKRTIGVATFARSDYSSCLPILRALREDAGLGLHLIAGGAHLAPEFGCTARDIEADGFMIDERVETLVSSDTPQGEAKSVGLGVIGLAQSFTRFRPDLLLVVGDRLELLAAAIAALAFRIPLAHVSGGDISEGAIDNQVRHALSKMSHVHFVAMPAHADRLRQMGEEPWRIFVSGDPALDLIRQTRLASRAELAEALRLELRPPVLLVTFHPTTLGDAQVEEEIDVLLAALGDVQGTLVFTYPNADQHSRVIVERVRCFLARRPGSGLFFSLGQRNLYSLLAVADLMVGNSSSGIWEAPSFRLPVVNIGERQRGRLRAANVIDAPSNADAIRAAVRRGLGPDFRASLRDLTNPYGDGHAAARIKEVLAGIELGPRLLRKRFVDLRDEMGTDGK